MPSLNLPRTGRYLTAPTVKKNRTIEEWGKLKTDVPGVYKKHLTEVISAIRGYPSHPGVRGPNIILLMNKQGYLLLLFTVAFIKPLTLKRQKKRH